MDEVDNYYSWDLGRLFTIAIENENSEIVNVLASKTFSFYCHQDVLRNAHKLALRRKLFVIAEVIGGYLLK